MKLTKFIFAITLLLFFNSNSNAVPVLNELIVPQYIGSKSAASANNTRTPFAVCLEINGLTPNTSYDLQIGIGLTSDGASVYGAGNIWNKNRNSFTGQRDTMTFTTDSNGDSGPFWCYLQPTGNGSRFNAGQVHNLRIGYVTTGGSFTGNPDFIGTKSFIALDIPVTERTAASTDDGAFIKGEGLTSFSGKYVLLYDNSDGSGSPLSLFMVRNSIPTNTTQTELPSSINDVYMQTGSSNTGDFAAVVPTGNNNVNGIKRVEIRNSNNTTAAVFLDNNGIWSNGTNTTTLARRDVGILNFFNLNLKVALEVCPLNGEKISVQLRNLNSPYDIVDTVTSIIDANGSGNFQFSNTLNNTNYFIIAIHRNSVETWSKSFGVSFSSGSMNYDFTTSASQAYGNNMVFANGKYSFYTGDVNQDGTVDLTDLGLIDNDAYNFVSGYANTDLNRDESVDITDAAYADNNLFNFVGTIRPR